MKSSKVECEFKEGGINIQVMFASHAAYSLLVSCFRGLAVLQRKHGVEGRIGRVHDD